MKTRTAGRRSAAWILVSAALVTLGGVGCSEPELRGRFKTEIVIPEKVAPNTLTRIRFLPDSDEFLLLRKNGRVLHYRLEGDSAVPLGRFEVPGVAPAPSDLGLADVVWDPDFAVNGRMYFPYTTGDDRLNRVVATEWSDDYDAIVEGLTVVLEVDRVKPPQPWHGLYTMAFGNDGYLYVPIGDANQRHFSQDRTSLLGKLLRIEPLAEGGYRVPDDNPNLGEDGITDEIVAFGMRTPWRMIPWRDGFFMAEVGSNQVEEINYYSEPNQNFGWPDCEGACDPPRDELTDPALGIRRDDDTFKLEDESPSGETQTSVVIGVIYPGGENDAYGGLLDDRLLFAELYQGYVRAAKVSGAGKLSPSQHLFHLSGVTSMDVGPDGLIYGTTFFDSVVFRIVPASQSSE